jgi:hypothetical protein
MRMITDLQNKGQFLINEYKNGFHTKTIEVRGKRLTNIGNN